MTKEISFKGVCPVELFEDMYMLSEKGILKMPDFIFKKDHVDVIYDGIWGEPHYVRIDEFGIWFNMYVSDDMESLILLLGPGGGECKTRMELNKDVLSFYNKWAVFKEDNPKYEEFKVVPVRKPPTEEEVLAFMQQIKCELCLFADHCNGLFCLRE